LTSSTEISGWSYNKGVPVLVYEYMTHGSLDHHLFRRGGHDNQNPSGARICQWNTRHSIVRDIATGLHYVHHEHEPMVLHRDIKAGNVMLDSTFRARLGDFGISCTVAPSKSYVTGIAGTFGYIGPDYAVSGKATRQTDIYAFGILILEVVTGKRNSDVQPDDDHITDWVWRLHKQGVLLQAVDTMLTAGGEQDSGILIDEARRLLLLGLACTNPNPSDRPSMVEVVQIINKLAPMPEVPQERPAFVWPPEDWRTRNLMCNTTVSDWGSSSTMELALASRDLPPSDTGKQASAYS
jgi:interleukin-1 receptor-associated kinase 1